MRCGREGPPPWPLAPRPSPLSRLTPLAPLPSPLPSSPLASRVSAAALHPPALSSRKVRQLAERVVLAVAPMPQGGAALTLRLSYMHARARFSLVLQLDSEAPEAPLRWRIDGWQQAAAHAATATPLQEAAAVVCEQYRCGFGRLLGMLDALDAVFAPKALGAPPR